MPGRCSANRSGSSSAARAFDFIAKDMTRGDRLGHSWREGKLLYPGLASDYAAMIKAALALARSDRLRKNISTSALAWQAAFDRHYANDDNGGYYLTADDAEGLVVRPDSTLDDATPNPNGIAAQNLIRLAVFTGDDSFRAKADRTDRRRAVGRRGESVRADFDSQRGRSAHRRRRDRDRRRRRRLAHRSRAEIAVPQPHRVARAVGGCAVAVASRARKSPRRRRSAAAFICVGQTCSLPVTTRGRDRASLRRLARLRRDAFSRFEIHAETFVQCAAAGTNPANAMCNCTR